MRYTTSWCEELSVARFFLAIRTALFRPDRYPYTGHSAILGHYERKLQNFDTVLLRFGKNIKTGRSQYHKFVQKSELVGKRLELTGGGLVRSAGGRAAVAALRKSGEYFKSDERILGDNQFIEKVLNAAQEEMEKCYSLKHAGPDFDRLLADVADRMSLKAEDIETPSKIRNRVHARSVFCYLANKKLGITLTDIAKRFNLTAGAISLSVLRGEKISQDMKLEVNGLLELKI